MSKLYNHQKEMLSFSLSHPHCCYLADVGTGKSRPAILTHWLRMQKGLAKRCLVLCPSFLLDNWNNEIKKTGINASVVIIYDNGKKKRLALLEKQADFYIMNYDYVDTIKYELVSKLFDTIIIDEITYIKNHAAKRSKATRIVSKDIPFRIGLTGFAVTNSPIDVFSEFLIIHPMLFGTNFWSFRNKYFENYGRYFPDWKPIKSMLSEMASKIASVSIYVDKNKCLDLPPIVSEQILLEMPNVMVADYKSMQKDLILEIEELGSVATAKIILTKLIRLAQITSGFIKDDEGRIVELGYNPKLDVLRSLLANELAGRKTIVWCRTTRTIKLLAKEFADLNPAVVFGEERKYYSEQINKFQEDPSCLLFIGQMRISYGYNLTASSIMIYFEHDFSVEKREQTLGRYSRIGQTADKLVCIDIAMKDSIDTYTLQSLEDKEDIANYIYKILGKDL